jgi:integrase
MNPHRVKLTRSFVETAERPSEGDRIIYWDERQPGFGLMVTEAGAKSWVVQYRAKGKGKSRRMSWRASGPDALSLDKARREATIVRSDALKGIDTLADRRREADEAADAKGNTLQAVIEQYMARAGSKLRSGDQRRAAFERLLYPRKLAKRPIHEISRSDIVDLLDRIEDERGPVMADHMLAYLRKAFNWHERRQNDFRSPIIRGMARTKPSERRRKRILTDDEVRRIWSAIEESPNAFGRFVQFSLLTGARRSEAAKMNHLEVQDDQWTIPASRYKTNMELLIPLSPMAMEILNKTPRIGHLGWVFTTSGRKPLGGFSKFKKALDKVSATSGWTIHDVRRSARTLLARAGVPAEHAERCVGHVLPGMQDNYNVYDYLAEKRIAFEKLAALVDQILNPPPAKVVSLHNRRA